MTRKVTLWGETPVRRGPYRGSLELVWVPTTNCPWCGQPTSDETVEVDALFRHAGHGSTLRTVRRCCTRCTWGTTIEISEARPPR